MTLTEDERSARRARREARLLRLQRKEERAQSGADAKTHSAASARTPSAPAAKSGGVMAELAKFQKRARSADRPVPKMYVTEQEVEHHMLNGEATIVAVQPYVERDPFPTPPPELRVNYNPVNDSRYWLNGFSDYLRCVEAMKSHGISDGNILEIGCSSGRVLRHFACDPAFSAYGCDLDRSTVQWVQEHFQGQMKVFQNSVLPHLPLEDNSFSAVLAFSVLTHIDYWEDTWIYELRRILKPGGIAYITAHTERTWAGLSENERIRTKVEGRLFIDGAGSAADIGGPMPADRLILRGRIDSPAYAVTTYHSTDYISRLWGSIMELVTILPPPPGRNQDIVILRKPAT